MSLEFKKSLVVVEDLALGFDPIVQERAGAEVTVQPINSGFIPYTTLLTIEQALDERSTDTDNDLKFALITGDVLQTFLVAAPTVDDHAISLGYSTIFAEKANVLELDNLDVYTPSNNYHPCTKKYADDINSSIVSNVILKDDTRVYAPTANYHPSTKKYVDDKFINGVDGTFTAQSGETITVTNGLITGIV